MVQQVQLTATVAESQLGQRLDQAMAELFPDYSRSRIKEWILDDRVQVNGKTANKPKEKVLGGEIVAIAAQIEEDPDGNHRISPWMSSTKTAIFW